MEGNLNLKEKSRKHIDLNINKIFVVSLIIAVSSYVGMKNHLLFHTLVEFTAAMISAGILVLALITHRFHKSSYFLFIGIIFAFTGSFDLIQALTYKGMGIFNFGSADIPTKLWIASRYIQALSFLMLFFIKPIHIKTGVIAGIYGLISILIISSIAIFNIFPSYGINGYGLTSFKIISEYIIITIFLGSMFMTYRRRYQIDVNVLKNINAFLVISILSDLTFTFYNDVYGLFNILGHMLKLISFHYIYMGIVKVGLKEPSRLLFSKLTRTEEALRDASVILEEKREEVKNMEELLLQSEEYYKILVELSEYSIAVHCHGKIEFANKNAAKLLEFDSPEELIGRSVLEFVHPDFQETIRKRQEDILNEEATLVPLDFKVIGQRGTEIYAQSMGTPFTFRGKPGILLVVRNITEKALLKEVLENDKQKTEAFANISHELKTPINVFFASLQLIEMYLKNDGYKANEEKIFSRIKTMKQNSYRVIKLVNNLIDINKIGAGFLQLKFQNLNVVSIIEDICQSVAGYVEEKGIEFVFDTEIEEKITALDPDKIERIMLNLLSNSIKFTNPGGCISVNIYDITDGIIISVKDSGVGIPEEELPTVFDRFKQVEGTIIRNGQGSGIGLSLVKSLVEMHGGNIKALSQQGSGTEFIIELPIRLVEEEEGILEKEGLSQNNIERINIEFSDIYA